LESTLLVRKIDHGTVIDHIPAWHSELVLRLLDVDEIKTKPNVSLISLNNVPSRKYGRKDIIKLYRYHLSEEDANLVCLVFPTVTVNHIEDWKTNKYHPRIPESILGRIRCPEVSCITNLSREPITTRFSVLPEFKALQCKYCDSLLDFEKMPEYVKK